MFTGLVQGVGTITAVNASHGCPVFTLETPLDLSAEKTGASICCSGVCLTALEISPHRFTVQAGFETLRLTTAQYWQVGTVLNLEPSLRVGDPLGGHIVSGHVDGVATLTALTPVNEAYRLVFESPKALLPFIAAKGSVALDGVSLTVVAADHKQFDVMIIPHTWQATSFNTLTLGATLNIEVDPIARYIARRQEFA